MTKKKQNLSAKLNKANPGPRVYFAHPMSTYGTFSEKLALKAIAKRFKGWKIINPSDEEIVGAVRVLYPLAGMDLFDVIVSKADAVVAMPFKDGLHGAGVFSELTAANRARVPLYLISAFPDKAISELDYRSVVAASVNETRARINCKIQ